MTTITPVWVWLGSRDEPVRAGSLEIDKGSRFIYDPDYLKTVGAVALDPVELRITRSSRGIAILGSDGLPGIIRDAKPAGYGEDRLKAAHGDNLDALQLLELGVPDGVGAVEACHDIERKLGWRPKTIADLQRLIEELERHEPSSRALRRLNDDLDTSAGGERPKATLVDEGLLWLVKMQSRGDRQAMPAREYVTMRLAQQAGLHVAHVKLHTFGAHQVLMVQRFDRDGDPFKPTRKLYASAHTVLRLRLDSVRGDPERSYLALADRLSVWTNDRTDSRRARRQEQLTELWRRIAFNALVGNTDDHALNTGLLFDRIARDREQMGWGLSPAFDITPNATGVPRQIEEGPSLALATGTDGRAGTSVGRLADAARRMGLDWEHEQEWMVACAQQVAQKWEPMLRGAAKPIIEDPARMDRLVEDVRPSFAYAQWLTEEKL
ncbi:MAG: type II toxin-antitoxin system HipA family toxin [Alcaligenaceae bacterium]|nr:MAG: type II toxin-antitoxin system HipA family toxin [Alcaligenaceae bacterium]